MFCIETARQEQLIETVYRVKIVKLPTKIICKIVRIKTDLNKMEIGDVPH